MEQLHCYQTISENFKISVVFEDDLLNLTVFENESAWNVKVSKDEIIKQSKKYDFKEYYANLRNYLMSCPQDVQIDFSSAGNSGKLTITLLLKNKMKVLFFTTFLKEVSFAETMFYLVEKLYNSKMQSLEELNNHKKQIMILEKDKKILEEKLNIFLERRYSEEQQLYTRFLAELNEKKQHIQHLTELLISLRKEKLIIGRHESNKEKKIDHLHKQACIPKKEAINAVTNSGDSSSSNTDNEELENSNDVVNTYSVITNRHLPVPSTSKTKINCVEESQPLITSRSKRIRTNNTLSLTVDLSEKNNSNSNKKDIKNSMESDKLKEQLYPPVEFSTQDLLDNL